MTSNLRVHDLLGPIPQGSARAEVPEQQPALERCLQQTPYAVVRRAANRANLCAIGVRGAVREDRYAAWLSAEDLPAIHTPQSLRLTGSEPDLPAYLALAELQQRWAGLRLPWGPGGSVGFSLASGTNAVIPTSDLDLIVLAENPLAAHELSELRNATQTLACRADILIETPLGGVALADLGRSRFMLRTTEGPRLVEDAWDAQVLA